MPRLSRAIDLLVVGMLSASCSAGPAAPGPAPVAPETGGGPGAVPSTGTAPTPATGTTSVPGGASPTASAARSRLASVPSRVSFRGAVAEATRTEQGVPGPQYWTQRVDYSIEAELNPETAILEGRELITYHNNSPDILDRVVLHLYQNLFAPGAERTRRVPVTDGVTIERVAVDGTTFPGAAGRAVRGSYLVDGTLMAIYLDEGLSPGQVLELEVDWRFQVPPEGAPRQGHIDNVLFNVAQWYPQVAVYDDLEGWNAWPYLGNGEFYLEYGDFDVSISVPEGWLVGASGTLQNPDEVLPPTILRRLEEAMGGEEVVRVVTQEDFGPGRATTSDSDGTLTWRFRAQNVRDFAFATSADYLWDAASVLTPDADGDGREERVSVHALYRPVAKSWTDAAEYIQHALRFHAERWHPYPWPQMTGAEGPVGGMEYPMLTFVAAFPQPRSVYETLNHEIGHMWFPMMVGSNEASYPWMDEGLTTYIEGYATADYWDDPEYWRTDQRAYLMVAGLELETPIMRHADLHGPYGTYGHAAYWKPAVLLRALESVIGRDAVWSALQAYSLSWIYGHPAPEDFFNLVEAEAGRDLDWFWLPFWYETAALDQAITEVRVEEVPGGGAMAYLTLGNIGGAVMPVSLTLAFSEGGTIEQNVPVDVWLDGTVEYTISVELAPGQTLESVEIDPEASLPDVDRENNVWQR